MSRLRSGVKRALKSLGIAVHRYDPRRDPVVLRRRMLERLGVGTIIDVGANAGQFAAQIRAEGFRGRIVSFEPLSSAFAALRQAAAADPHWEVRQCALGSESGEAIINVAGNSWSSSILPMLDLHRNAAPESGYVGTEKVRVSTLDAECANIADSPAFLKIDTQGFTMKVLEGATAVLPRMSGVQVELSLAPLYAGEPLVGDVATYLYSRGFRLVLVEPEFADADGYQLQVNGVFVRDEFAGVPARS